VAHRICLIESDRGEEKQRSPTAISRTKPAAAKALQTWHGPGDRVAIIMTNQSKWLIPA